MAKKKNNNEMSISGLFANPLMQVQLDLDLEKLTEFTLQLQNKDKKGVHFSNRGGWHSSVLFQQEKHEELNRLKKEISKYLQIYHSEVFQNMVFLKGNITHNIHSMWVNINEKHHHNEWHIHSNSTLSGTYYIKHDGDKNGNIVFKHPHWPDGIVKYTNSMASQHISVQAKSNMLLIFPSWLEHKVETNLKDDTRISLSFNSSPILENKS